MSVNEALEYFQAHTFATDALFQSLFSAMDPQKKQEVMDSVAAHFDVLEGGDNSESVKRKLEAARVIAKRVLGD